MKSVVYSRTGDPSVLQLVDRDVIEPAPGEVRVRIVVSGVNPTDWKSRLGSGDGAAPPFPEVTPNQDGAGVSSMQSGRVSPTLLWEIASGCTSLGTSGPPAPRRSTRTCLQSGSYAFRKARASTSVPVSEYRR